METTVDTEILKVFLIIFSFYRGCYDHSKR